MLVVRRLNNKQYIYRPSHVIDRKGKVKYSILAALFIVKFIDSKKFDKTVEPREISTHEIKMYLLNS